MTTATWQGRIAAAPDERAVIVVARDFVAALQPAEIASLAPECRPGGFVDANDVSEYALTLVRSRCADAGSAALVWKLSDFFAKASIRLSQIAAVEAEERRARQTA